MFPLERSEEEELIHAWAAEAHPKMWVRRIVHEGGWVLLLCDSRGFRPLYLGWFKVGRAPVAGTQWAQYWRDVYSRDGLYLYAYIESCNADWTEGVRREGGGGMKASEMIEKLELIRAAHGDPDVVMRDDNGALITALGVQYLATAAYYRAYCLGTVVASVVEVMR